MNESNQDRLLDEPQAAVQLGVSLWTMRKWRLAGRIQAIRLGHRTVRYKQSDIDAFLKTSQTQAVK